MVEIVNDPLVHQVPIKRRGCRFPEEKPDHYKLFKYYSYSTCVLECRAIKMLEHCNCINHIIHPGKQVCTRVVPKSYENSLTMVPVIIVPSFPVRWWQRMLSRVVCFIFSTPCCVSSLLKTSAVCSVILWNEWSKRTKTFHQVLFQTWQNVYETYSMLWTAADEENLSKSQMYRWFSRFRDKFLRKSRTVWITFQEHVNQFFHCNRVVHLEFVSPGQTVNQQYCADVLSHL